MGDDLQLLDAGSAQALGAIVLESDGLLTGDLTGNGTVTLQPSSTVDGNVAVGGDADLKAVALIGGDLSTAGISQLGLGATVDGTITDGAASPNLAPVALPTCTVTAPGGPDIKTASREAFGLLSPGDYGAVHFGAKNQVELCGDYSFESLRFSPQAQIEISCPTTLHIAYDLTFNNGVTQTLSGTATPETVVYRIDGGMTVDDQGESVTGAGARLYGTLCAPHGVLRLGKNVQFEGALYGWQLDLDAGLEFIAAPAANLD